MNIKVTDKAVTINGHEMWLKLIELDGVEGWTSGQVQEYFLLSGETLRQATKRGRIVGVRITHTQTIRHLKLAGAAPNKLTHTKFYSKDEIRELAMVVNTPQARDMIRHAFDITEAVYKGDIKAAQTLAGFSEDEAIEQAERAIQGWKSERAAHKVTQLELVQTTTLYEVARESALTSAKMKAESDKQAMKTGHTVWI